ncbi:hypothetical protein ES288_A06G112700v1 [Gossypium darwinii]|uniref:Uncharacterized protein n=1 Tax=Gossypium darwinii TaxID=34276 RepID=A0A5D2G6J0_GOSDA|nr:hypothetical protein ES288_A06G112700v1 [Gossypium darwinii]
MPIPTTPKTNRRKSFVLHPLNSSVNQDLGHQRLREINENSKSSKTSHGSLIRLKIQFYDLPNQPPNGFHNLPTEHIPRQARQTDPSQDHSRIRLQRIKVLGPRLNSKVLTKNNPWTLRQNAIVISLIQETN